ncbi:5'-adenylylsulfate reductase 1, chloroplastic [Tetrabaena socialis]|uniref:5'-adenylylsulfate reductase 1, chloroplastic n=1 Tax=Tetrabaena socialis TaxID=47790 RepID=A0A2J7ZSS7_9CHLO|nr:5'-adenylylsulfate reductase 1, chloroplastic [Tetrabaena socialis]|eukprot:PNH03321.1 5'-adenylylsulfate reductase 1, chloroplastic [Tetrabaena socialis]
MQLTQGRAFSAQRAAAQPASRRVAVRTNVARVQLVNAAAIATKHDWAGLAAEMELKSPLEIMDHALKTLGGDIGIAFSGAEDVALIEYAHLTGRPYRVFSGPSWMLARMSEAHGNADPQHKGKAVQVSYSFKVALVALDCTFLGRLLATSAEASWWCAFNGNVPVNSLHACGYVSIGCEPCTRPVLPNQAEREGRWWWEDAAAKECGLHSGNVKKADGTSEERKAERDLWPAGSAVESLSKEQAHALASGNRDKGSLVVLYAPWCPFCQAMEASYEALAAQLAGGHVRVAKYQADIDREFASESLHLKTFPTIVYLPANSTQVIKYPSERRDVETLAMWVKTVAGTK